MAFSCRAALTMTAVVAVVLASAACDDYRDDYVRGDLARCDYTYRQCRTICNYSCDYWSCYPICFDDCYLECVHDPAPSTPAAPDPLLDAGAPSTPAPPSPGTGTLCTSCSSNSECESGAVCILRGGTRDAGAPASARGFCGRSCATSADCPEGFLCSQLGSSMQCLPTAGNCE